jgi:hypothetical protein
MMDTNKRCGKNLCPLRAVKGLILNHLPVSILLPYKCPRPPFDTSRLSDGTVVVGVCTIHLHTAEDDE